MIPAPPGFLLSNERNATLPQVFLPEFGYAEYIQTSKGDATMDVKESLQEQMRRAVVEKAYLNYFNNSLLEQGLITPEEHRKMKLQIATRKPGGSAR